MCGINGIFVRGKNAERVDPEEVARVRDHMASRGPDHAGIWTSDCGSVGLGHRRLSIIDLSVDGNQPMVGNGGNQILVFNGEIYNYAALRSELIAQGIKLRTQSDTEVILALYEREGCDAFRRLRGMFALAIWDIVRRQLVLARDPMGIKPLYLAEADGAVRFASQVKALLAGRGIDRSPDPAGHVGFLLWGHVPEPFSLYQGIRMVPPGSYVVVEEDGDPTVVRYFDLKGCLQGLPERKDTEFLREVLEDSARAHFVADVPVSLFLSAGRDSSTLLALASQVRSEPVHAVTLAFEEFEGTPMDESPLAAEIAARYGANHLVHQVSSSEFLEDLDGLIAAMDQPSIDGANTYFVCKVAAQLGVRVALSGLGADELFGGYPSFEQVPKTAKLLKWSNAMPGLGRSVRKGVSRFPRHRFSPKYAGLLEYGGSIEGAYQLRRGLFMPWEIPDMLEPEFAYAGLAQLSSTPRLQEISSGLPNDHARMVALEYCWYMQGRLLRDSDWASMAHSLELRTPFVDVEVLRRLGPWLVSSNPPTKEDMARCPVNPLPNSVLNRPKTGFVVPIEEWVREVEPGVKGEATWRGWARYIYRRLAGTDHLRVHDTVRH